MACLDVKDALPSHTFEMDAGRPTQTTDRSDVEACRCAKVIAEMDPSSVRAFKEAGYTDVEMVASHEENKKLAMLIRAANRPIYKQ